MENLDRFFEAYDRFLPSYFSEVAVAAVARRLRRVFLRSNPGSL